jgi:hypothetical protein
VVFALKNKLMHDGTYWLNLPAISPDFRENEFPYLALVEHTNFMDKEHYGGEHIIPTERANEKSEADAITEKTNNRHA